MGFEQMFAQMQGFTLPFLAVLVAEVLDMLFGLSAAVVNKEVSSSKMREGIGHKLGIMGTMVIAAFAELCCTYIGLPIDVPIVGGVAVWLVLMELCSICEILVKLNPDLSENPFFGIVHNAFDKERENVHNY